MRTQEAIRQTVVLLAASTALALTVNAFSPVGLAVTRPLTLRELDPRYISAEETKARHDGGQSLFLDARRPELFARGHIAGAQNLPVDEFGDRFAAMGGWLPKETEMVVYCDGKSCALSRQLAEKLVEVGCTRVLIFRDGWTVWKERGWAAE